ncbi:MAG TPA: hypothetical protein V6D10_23945 [Trichocoleus sp.]|jgi:hypothetical protein
MQTSKIPTNLLLSFSTIPLLAVLIGSKAIGKALIELGQASEEIFRGDRLPVLEREEDTKQGSGNAENE